MRHMATSCFPSKPGFSRKQRSGNTVMQFDLRPKSCSLQFFVSEAGAHLSRVSAEAHSSLKRPQDQRELSGMGCEKFVSAHIRKTQH
jgi:hypothetical protein